MRQLQELGPEPISLPDHGVDKILKGLSLHRNIELTAGERIISRRQSMAHDIKALGVKGVRLLLPSIDYNRNLLSHP